jgi:hypothetical protein
MPLAFALPNIRCSSNNISCFFLNIASADAPFASNDFNSLLSWSIPPSLAAFNFSVLSYCFSSCSLSFSFSSLAFLSAMASASMDSLYSSILLINTPTAITNNPIPVDANVALNLLFLQQLKM